MNDLQKYLDQSREIIEKEYNSCGYARAYGYLETAVESYIERHKDEINESSDPGTKQTK